jgi:hypothetical protein
MKKLLFMLGKLVTDLKSKGHDFPLSQEYTTRRLGKYYIDFGHDLSKLNKLIKDFDSDGIPLNDAYIDVKDGKPHYYPISIGQVGLSIFHEYLASGNQEKLQHFLKIANWFVKEAQEDDLTGTYWLTHIPKPEYHVFNNWKSAFAQSRAISILLRAWQVTSDERYLQLAKGALKPFTLDISKGGVAIRRPHAEVFYEEYVAAYPTRVLDGHIFSLFGLYDYVRAVSGPDHDQSSVLAKDLFDQGLSGLLEALPKYDLNFWVQFNRCEVPGYPSYDPCTINYLQLISSQLEVLYHISLNEEFKRYQLKFKNYLTWPNIIRMYRLKFKALTELNRI